MDDQQEAQSAEPESVPEAQPSPPGGASVAKPARKRAGISRGAIVTLFVGVGIMVLGTFYAGEIKGFFRVQPWNKSAPCAVVDRFMEALKGGDASTAQELLGGEKATVTVQDGRITAVKPSEASPQMPPADVSKLIIADKASSGKVTFDINAIRSSVSVTARTEQGGDATFALTKNPDGQWYLVMTAPGM